MHYSISQPWCILTVLQLLTSCVHSKHTQLCMYVQYMVCNWTVISTRLAARLYRPIISTKHIRSQHPGVAAAFVRDYKFSGGQARLLSWPRFQLGNQLMSTGSQITLPIRVCCTQPGQLCSPPCCNAHPLIPQHEKFACHGTRGGSGIVSPGRSRQELIGQISAAIATTNSSPPRRWPNRLSSFFHLLHQVRPCLSLQHFHLKQHSCCDALSPHRAPFVAALAATQGLPLLKLQLLDAAEVLLADMLCYSCVLNSPASLQLYMLWSPDHRPLLYRNHI